MEKAATSAAFSIITQNYLLYVIDLAYKKWDHKF